MIDENILYSYIPSRTTREAMKKEHCHYTNYEWFIIFKHMRSLKPKRKHNIFKYIMNNTYDDKLHKHIKIYLIYELFERHYNYRITDFIDKHIEDFSEDVEPPIYIPNVFKQGDVVYDLDSKDVMTVLFTFDFYKEYKREIEANKKDKYPIFCYEPQIPCTWGIFHPDDMDEYNYINHEHISILELELLDNLYTDNYWDEYPNDDFFYEDKSNIPLIRSNSGITNKSNPYYNEKINFGKINLITGEKYYQGIFDVILYGREGFIPHFYIVDSNEEVITTITLNRACLYQPENTSDEGGELTDKQYKILDSWLRQKYNNTNKTMWETMIKEWNHLYGNVKSIIHPMHQPDYSKTNNNKIVEQNRFEVFIIEIIRTIKKYKYDKKSYKLEKAKYIAKK